MLRLYQYKNGSKSAKALADELGIKRLKREGSKFIPKVGRTILNWGATTMPDLFAGGTIINHPEDVERASNKLSFFKSMEEHAGVRTLPWTANDEMAKIWLERGGSVVCRTILNGHSGNGIVIADELKELVPAKLYTKYVKKQSEWRIHVAFDKVFDVQRKVKRADAEDVDWRVRNHAGGFIFQRQNLDVPEDVTHQAIECMAASLLDFGAVDVLWNEHEQKAYVLEINTAPGLEGESVIKYGDVFREYK